MASRRTNSVTTIRGERFPQRLISVVVSTLVFPGTAYCAVTADASGQAAEQAASQAAVRVLHQTAQSNLIVPRVDPAADLPASSVPGAAPASGAHVAAAAPRPDERPLWRLLNRGDVMQLDAAIVSFERKFPAWSPPADLLRERARQVRERDIEMALKGDIPLLKQLLAQEPDAFGCERIDRAWRAADLLAKDGNDDRAAIFGIYRRIVPACTSDINRVTTLQRSVAQLAPAQVDALIGAEEAHGTRGATAERSLTRLRDARALDSLANVPVDSTASAAGLDALAAPIRASEDGDAALRAGWLAYAQHRPDRAADWFTLARAFDNTTNTAAKEPGAGRPDASRSVDATLGLVQARIGQGDTAGADALLQTLHADNDARVRALRTQIALAQASDAYRRKHYAESLHDLDVAAASGASPAQIEIMQGWSLFGSGDYARAASVFGARYRREHDDDSAEGLALSQRALARQGSTRNAQAATAAADTANAIDTAQADPSQQKGPLAGYTAALRAQALFYQKQFVAASAAWTTAEASSADPARLAHYLPSDLTGIGAASVTSGLAWFDHAGVKGSSRLTTFTPSIEGLWYDNTRSYDLQYKQHVLSAGTGSVSAEQLQFTVNDTVSFNDRLRFDVSGSAGVTQGGDAGVVPQGELAIGQHLATAQWSGYAGSAPVRDSLLSWLGDTRSPTGDTAWRGAVKRQYAGGSANWQIAPRWTVSTGGDLEWLAGHDVQGNEGVKADASVNYDLGLPGFDYVSVGPTVHYLGYRRNENFYVPGQGGYYSPQMSASGGAMLQMLSKEGATWQWLASFELGWNYTHQSNGDCGSSVALGATCIGSNDRGMYGHVQFATVKQLAAQWQIGGLVDVNVTPGRDKQIAAMAFLRYFLSPRARVFSTDLPRDVQNFHSTWAQSR